jgi:hydroxymethylpyrimidine/phosphomethylpyrimidine kinase
VNDRSASSVELAIALPLGVVANQLKRVESDLRFLSAKTAVLPQDRDSADMVKQVAARLEQINEALDSIRALIVDIERDLQPKTANAVGRRRDDRDD